MANKAISELPQAENVNNQDLFVLEQGGLAKKLTAETFITEQGIIDALAEALDGHGGIQSVTLQSLSGRVRTYLITFSDGSATTFQVLDGSTITNIQKTSTAGLVDTYTVYMSDGTTTFFQVRNGQDGSATWDQINSKAPIITETVTGAIANFPDGADNIPVADLVVNIEPKQSGSGDPAPDNIRPITGWTGCNVTKAGKNLLETSLSKQIYKNGTPTITYGNGSVTIHAQTVSAFYVLLSIMEIKEQHIGMQFTMSTYPLETLSFLRFVTANADGSSRVEKQYSYTATITSADVGKILCIRLYNSTGADKAFTNIQVEVGSTATTYEPYTSTSLAIDWTTEAGTVYGGSLDVTTGVLTVTDGYIASYAGETLPATWISDRDVYAPGTTPTTGAEVVYKLDTQQAYQLTPQEVRTFLGTNNIWADTGNTTVEYRADTKLYIEKLTMPTEDDMVANQAITSGKFFMVGNNLYIATAAIASGAQIIEGTNATRLSLADALNRL